MLSNVNGTDESELAGLLNYHLASVRSIRGKGGSGGIPREKSDGDSRIRRVGFGVVSLRAVQAQKGGR